MSERDGDDANTPAITVAAIAVGLAVIVLVVLVAIIIWHRLRKHKKLVLATFSHAYWLHMAYVEIHIKNVVCICEGFMWL